MTRHRRMRASNSGGCTIFARLSKVTWRAVRDVAQISCCSLRQNCPYVANFCPTKGAAALSATPLLCLRNYVYYLKASYKDKCKSPPCCQESLARNVTDVCQGFEYCKENVINELEDLRLCFIPYLTHDCD